MQGSQQYTQADLVTLSDGFNDILEENLFRHRFRQRRIPRYFAALSRPRVCGKLRPVNIGWASLAVACFRECLCDSFILLR